jgi:DNA end-binding protein Ku
VVIKTRQHLAAVKPKDRALVLELMHFADELISPASLHLPATAHVGKGEMEMAKVLISRMTAKWDPTKYKDDYKSAVMALIEEKIKAGGAELPTPTAKGKRPAKIIDLMEVLKQSLSEAAKPAARQDKRAAAKPHRKKAA